MGQDENSYCPEVSAFGGAFPSKNSLKSGLENALSEKVVLGQSASKNEMSAKPKLLFGDATAAMTNLPSALVNTDKHSNIDGKAHDSVDKKSGGCEFSITVTTSESTVTNSSERPRSTEEELQDKNKVNSCASNHELSGESSISEAEAASREQIPLLEEEKGTDTVEKEDCELFKE